MAVPIATAAGFQRSSIPADIQSAGSCSKRILVVLLTCVLTKEPVCLLGNIQWLTFVNGRPSRHLQRRQRGESHPVLLFSSATQAGCEATRTDMKLRLLGARHTFLYRPTATVYQILPQIVNPHFILLLRIFVFYTTAIPLFCTVFHLEFPQSMCYITVRKGDTNVQVNPKGSKHQEPKPDDLLKEDNFRHTSNSLREWWIEDHAADWIREQKKSSILQKERLTNDVRYQDRKEITLDCKKFWKRTAVKGYFFFYRDYRPGRGGFFYARFRRSRMPIRIAPK